MIQDSVDLNISKHDVLSCGGEEQQYVNARHRSDSVCPKRLLSHQHTIHTIMLDQMSIYVKAPLKQTADVKFVHEPRVQDESSTAFYDLSGND